MKRIKRMLVRDAVMEEIQEAIARGEYKVGSKLPSVRCLAETLGTSPSGVREALTALEALGVVSIRHGEGVFVQVRSLAAANVVENILENESIRLREIVEVRRGVETECARLAAERATKHEQRELEQIMEELESAQGDADAYLECDLRFHQQLAKASHNSLFVRIIDSLAEPLLEAISATVGLPGAIKVGHGQHRRIFERVQCGDALGASEEMARHMEFIEDLVFGDLESSS